MKNVKNVSICGFLILAGAFALAVRREGRYPIITESGQALPSLFDGVPRAEWIKQIALAKPKVQSCAEIR